VERFVQYLTERVHLHLLGRTISAAPAAEMERSWEEACRAGQTV